MEALALVARLVLAATFIVSAVAKLRDREGARRAAADLGVPAGLAPAAAVSLAPLELVSAILLLTTGWLVAAGAALAGLLLLAFTVAIVASLARGQRVECHCFGSLSAKPLSWWSVARNLALLALVALVLAGGASQTWPWQEVGGLFAPLTAAERWLWLAVIVLTVAVAVLLVLFTTVLGSYGQVLLRLETLEAAMGLTPGRAAPAQPFQPYPLPHLQLTAADGSSSDLRDLLSVDDATVFVAVSPSCEACGRLVEELRGWQADPGGPAVVVISPGPRAAIASKFGDVVVHEHHPADQTPLGLEYTPGAVGTAEGQVLTPAVYGADEVRRLYLTLAGRAPTTELVLGPPPVRAGDPVPDVTVGVVPSPSAGESPHPMRTSHTGLSVSLPLEQAIAHVVEGGDAVLLFWDTTCGFCQQITEDVARRAELLPLVVVLRGEDVDVVRRSGISAPVLLDPAFAVGNAVQAPGTPCAVRVRDGVLASTVAVGGPEVLDLLAAARIGS